MRRRNAREINEIDCRVLTEAMLPGYVSDRFYGMMGVSEEMARRVGDMAEVIRVRMKRLVQESDDWMSLMARQRTVKKLDQIIIRVGHPNYGILEPFGTQMRADSYMKNLDWIRKYRVIRNWARWDPESDIRHQLDRDSMQRFNAPLSLVNAMYSPISNTITIYAGIMQHPFLHEKYNDATLFATLGMVIAHELSHSVDPVGRRFDGEGTYHKGMIGYWDLSSTRSYDRRVLDIINEYGSPHNVGDLHGVCPALAVNNEYGQRTITEDVADLIGIRAAYEAYFMDFKQPNARTETKAAVSHRVGTPGEKQMFFYSFAQLWCSISDPEVECNRVLNDVHAVPRVRVDSTLRMLPYFTQAFGCPLSGYYMTNITNHNFTLYGRKL
jgi:putative endopeptidase